MRLSLSTDEQKRLSRAACGHLLRDQVWRKACCVALYIAVRGETDPCCLMEDAWAARKTVLLPACSPDTKGEMCFCPCQSHFYLRPGLYGIPEPLPIPVAERPDLTPDLFVVPGVAFTAKGQRLGQGGGYYDRLLARPEYANTLRIGLAYSFQLLPKLPNDAWDLPVHALATEKGLLWTK